jgi:hypothetical protein
MRYAYGDDHTQGSSLYQLTILVKYRTIHATHNSAALGIFCCQTRSTKASNNSSAAEPLHHKVSPALIPTSSPAHHHPSTHQSIANPIHARPTGPKATPTETFARATAKALLRPRPPRYFTFGYGGWLALALYFTPKWVSDWLLAKYQGVDRVLRSESKRD